jgi:flagellar biosynthesis protein FliR
MSNKCTLLLLLFARLSGFFLFSPLFSEKNIPKTIRLGLCIACSLLIAPPFSAQFDFTIDHPALWAIQLFKELAIGYLLGFVFSLLMEAAAFAGQFVGTLMGLSATELLDPLATSSHPLMARFFSLFVFTLFLALDLHHPLLRLLYESFEALPPSGDPFTAQTAFGVIQTFNLLFHHALMFALLPLTLLLCLIALFALLSRFFPIFWIGFPLQLLVGFTTLILSIGFFAPLLEHVFFQLWDLVKKAGILMLLSPT